MYLGQVLRVNRRMGNLLTQLFGTKKHSQNDKSGSSKSTRATPEGRDKAEFELKKARDRIDKYIKRVRLYMFGEYRSLCEIGRYLGATGRTRGRPVTGESKTNEEARKRCTNKLGSALLCAILN
eukprot:gb/GECG01012973.1/.p1 GENE.gb/GECG01012973.1/~~gb/GECG01012973.1/.p1  ORF type:complete len:124 (+),score=17.51 gb/GECG01012973.1/:1-372(+)